MRLAWPVFLLCACAAPSADELVDGVDDSFLALGRADAFGVAEGSPTACAALRVANEASLSELDDEAGLYSRAAEGIVASRPFTTLVALDDTPFVGPVAFEALVAHAEVSGRTCTATPGGDLSHVTLRRRLVDSMRIEDELHPGMVLGFTFVAEPGRLDSVAHGVGTSTTAVARIYGPLVGDAFSASSLVAEGAPVGQTDAVFDVELPARGTYLLTVEEASDRQGFMRVHAISTPILCASDADCPHGAECMERRIAGTVSELCAPRAVPFDHDACTEPGGIYATVPFTAEESCRALDFLNHASWSRMLEAGNGLAHLAFQGPVGSYTSRRFGEWSSLAQFSRHRFDHGSWTSTNLRALRSASRDFTVDTHEPDTVATTWSDRTRLDGGPVILERVLVTRRVAVEGYSCAEIRDDADSANYLLLCHDCWGAASCEFDTPLPDAGPTCERDRCGVGAASRVGEWIRVYGTFGQIGTRWAINTAAEAVVPVR